MQYDGQSTYFLIIELTEFGYPKTIGCGQKVVQNLAAILN